MLCFETKLSREPYLSALEAVPDGAELSSLLFFDIETTGLSPSSAQIYLIGALCFPKKGPLFFGSGSPLRFPKNKNCYAVFLPLPPPSALWYILTDSALTSPFSAHAAHSTT